MTTLSMNEQLEAMAILSDCVDNGRVEADESGKLNPASVQVEVSFQAGEQGYDSDTAEAMGDYAAQSS
jgi:hypothetical protein